MQGQLVTQHGQCMPRLNLHSLLGMHACVSHFKNKGDRARNPPGGSQGKADMIYCCLALHHIKHCFCSAGCSR